MRARDYIAAIWVGGTMSDNAVSNAHPVITIMQSDANNLE